MQVVLHKYWFSNSSSGAWRQGTVVYWVGSVLFETQYRYSNAGIEYNNYVVSFNQPCAGMSVCSIVDDTTIPKVFTKEAIEDYIRCNILPILVMAIDGK